MLKSFNQLATLQIDMAMAAAAATSLPPRFGAVSMTRPRETPAARFRRSRGKRVSWASADQLCQIRMFLAEDAPFLAGIAQDQLQVKTSTFMHCAVDLPPGFGGGFGSAPGGIVAAGGNVSSSCMKADTESLVASVVPAISWNCPQKIELNPAWHVESGEDSQEVEVQRRRESTTLEVFYPRSSAIPTSPLEPLDQGLMQDDRQIPLISVIAPDEDSDGEETTTIATTQAGASLDPTKPSMGYGFNQTETSPAFRNIAAGSNGFYTGDHPHPVPIQLSQANDHQIVGSSINKGIDTSLLLQLLANPSLVETLSGVRNNSMVNSTSNGNHAANLVVPNSSSSAAAAVKSLNSLTPVSSSNLMTSSSSSQNSPPMGFSALAPPATSFSWGTHQQAAAPGFQQQFQQQVPPVRPPGLTRENEQYFKELIMQHGGMQAQVQAGGGNQHHVQQQQHLQQQQHHHHQPQQQQQKKKQGGGNGYVTSSSNGYPPGFGNGLLADANKNGASKPRRVCAYYNTAKGCRNGLKCPFVHEVGKRGGGDLQQQQQQQKRMRG